MPLVSCNNLFSHTYIYLANNTVYMIIIFKVRIDTMSRLVNQKIMIIAMIYIMIGIGSQAKGAKTIGGMLKRSINSYLKT